LGVGKKNDDVGDAKATHNELADFKMKMQF
jgi:hypothetical protein